jgi:hypothetical protein
MVMSPAGPRSRHRSVLDVIMAGIATTLVAAVSSHPAVAEVIGGALIVGMSILTGSQLARRLAGESDFTSWLMLNLLAVLVVVIGLAGVAVMGLAIP